MHILAHMSNWLLGPPLCSMTVARNVTLATPITVDLLQLGNSYITRQLKQACTRAVEATIAASAVCVAADRILSLKKSFCCPTLS